MGSRTEPLSPAQIVEALAAEPLIGVTAASEILGIASPNFKRDAKPHLTVVEVQGTKPVYFRSEVVALAAEWAGRFRKADGRRDSGVERRRAAAA